MQCTDCSNDFKKDPQDLMPARRCPDCRIRLLLSFRNERGLYVRTCDACNKSMVGTYPANSPYTVYCSSCWWSDSWDAQDFSLTYDDSRPFLDQVKELYSRVPHLGMNVIDCVNSDFTNYSDKNKDCYLVVSAANNENVYYSEQILHNKDSAECNLAGQLELCYWTQSSHDCYRTHFSEFCEKCTDCWFCFDCRGSRNCFGSFGLRNAEYMFLNEQLDKPEYEKRLAELKLATPEGITAAKEIVYTHWKTFPHKYANVSLSEDVAGDNLTRAKNCFYVFDGSEVENCRYCHGSIQGKDSQYCVPADGCERCYNNMSIWKVYNVNCCYACWYSNDVTYSLMCMHSQELFGCVGMRHKKHAILNTVYPEVKYQELKADIIKQLEAANIYGEFFPPNWNPFPYNRTAAMKHYPLSQTEAEKLGYTWETNKSESPAPSEALPTCVNCSSLFRILDKEKALYQQLGVPAPEQCPDCRYHERLTLKNPRQLYQRDCMYKTCGKKLMSSYAPARPEVIYCEQHYQEEYN